MIFKKANSVKAKAMHIKAKAKTRDPQGHIIPKLAMKIESRLQNTINVIFKKISTIYERKSMSCS